MAKTGTGSSAQDPERVKAERDRFIKLAFCRADLLFELDRELTIVYGAGATDLLFSMAPDELPGTSFLALIDDKFRPKVKEMLSSGAKGGSGSGGDGAVMDPEGEHATYMKGNLLWHTDSSFKPVPCTYSILAAHEVPDCGGETEFADLRACYDDWVGPFGEFDKGALEGLQCEHSIIYSRSLISGDIFTDAEKRAFEPPHHPLVRTHPRTGRKVYYVGSHCSHVVGWPVERGRALIRELTGFCIRPQHVYSHSWRAGDVVVWDNRSVLHRGRTYDPAQRRVMHRATVAGATA